MSKTNRYNDRYNDRNDRRRFDRREERFEDPKPRRDYELEKVQTTLAYATRDIRDLRAAFNKLLREGEQYNVRHAKHKDESEDVYNNLDPCVGGLKLLEHSLLNCHLTLIINGNLILGFLHDYGTFIVDTFRSEFYHGFIVSIHLSHLLNLFSDRIPSILQQAQPDR